jgi:ABC-2 type transport system permease protein
MKPFLAMTRANLRMTVRNRTALFWNLIFPALFILIFGAIFSDETLDIEVGITGETSDFRSAVVDQLHRNEVFTVKTGDDAGSELAKLEDGDRDVVLVFGPEPPDGGVVPVHLYYDETDGPNAQIAVSAIRQVLMEVAQGENPVPIQVEAVSALDISFMDFFLPGILGMAIMNSGVIGLSTSFVTYRERGILRRIKVTPFGLPSFVGSRIVSLLIVAIPQALILVGIAKLLFDLHLRGNPLLVLVVIFAGALAFLAIGFAVSSIAPNVETAATFANLITFPMLFLSGVFFDVDAAPDWLDPLTKILPLRYLVDALREVMTRGKGIEAIWFDLLVLAATFAAGMLMAVRFFRWEARAS